MGLFLQLRLYLHYLNILHNLIQTQKVHVTNNRPQGVTTLYQWTGLVHLLVTVYSFIAKHIIRHNTTYNNYVRGK